MFIEKKVDISPDMAASRFHENSPKVLSSPSLVMLMQTTCADLMAPFLDKGEMVVSTRIEMNHFASTPIGVTLDIRAEIIKVKGSTLYFKIEAFDGDIAVAAGFNDMFIVNLERFEKGITRRSAFAAEKGQTG